MDANKVVEILDCMRWPDNEYSSDDCYQALRQAQHSVWITEKFRWIPVTERLPEIPDFDWVLTLAKFVPENWYGVPHVAELRNGVWYCTEVDTPMEDTLSIKVTHWMPLPEPPEVE